MALFDKLRNDGTLSLRGNQGPTFENEGQRFTSDIQALASNNNLVSSQDLVKGRTYGISPNQTKVAPSILDTNGKTPTKYLDVLGGMNSSQAPTFESATGTGFVLEKRLFFSGLGLRGAPGPLFESEGQRSTSDIQALASGNSLQSSQDLLSGRNYGKGRFTVFVPPSTLDTSGIPVNGEYRNKGPREGRY